jgi:glutathione synthase/RimK-type ligase-like ATP-grasp enzyme
MKSIVVVNNPKDWDFKINDVEIVSAKFYLTDKQYSKAQNLRVFNLCRSYKYQATGYYVSLLAEARGHRAFPTVSTMQDFRSSTIIRVISDDIDDLIQRSLRKIKSKEFVLSIYFGRNVAKQYDELSKQLYNLFQAPLLRATFTRNKKWVLQYISPIPVNEIPKAHKKYLEQFAKIHFSRKRISSMSISRSKYDLAILVDPLESEPPSDKRALKKFIEIANTMDIRCELITEDDYNRIPEFDALFIRQVTAVNNPTYRFSRRAFTEGLVVIDDPWSILKCTNKVYLTELLSLNKIPIPNSIIVSKDNLDTVHRELGFPVVLKKPDSSFSQGVVKVEDLETLNLKMNELLDDSDLIIAQEYSPTDFDWRIGMLDKKILFACKYFMAKGHWQIYKWKDKSSSSFGNFEAVPVNNVPPKVLEIGLKAANLIGDGLYGVDLKQIGDKVMVIEINDNPSIEAGVEDVILKDELYRSIMHFFKTRIEHIRSKTEIKI